TAIIRLAQPYGSFATALLERQAYPDLRNSDGSPIPPYDVTAHSLALLMNVDFQEINEPVSFKALRSRSLSVEISGCPDHGPRWVLYRSDQASMDEGWTRWIFESSGNDDLGCSVDKIDNKELRTRIEDKPYHPTKTIIFPDQSPNQILNGYAKGTMPDEYVGGVGKEGVENLKRFV